MKKKEKSVPTQKMLLAAFYNIVSQKMFCICCALLAALSLALATTSFHTHHPSFHLTSITSRWTGNWSTTKAVFLGIADLEYFYFARNLVDSLVSLNYSATDVVVACISKECQHRCVSSGYRCHFIVNDLMKSDCGGLSRYKYISYSRCLVSTVKIDSTLSLLSAGYVVVGLDLVVFLRNDPLRAFVPVESDPPLVTMFEDTGTNGHYLNFGFFVVRPCNSTVEMFTWMKQEFMKTGKHDQLLYNTYVSTKNISVQRLDNELFVNYVDTRRKYSLMTGVQHTHDAAVVIHTTCVEGAFTKFFIARTVFGRVFNKKFYNGMRTVSSYMHPNSTVYEKASFIDMLVNISRQTNRWIRILGSHSDILASTFSADKLARKGIFLVEASYWESVVEFNGTFIPSTTLIEVVPGTDLSLLKYIQTDDLVLDISLTTFNDNPIWKWDLKRPLNQSLWLCTLFAERKEIHPFNASCLMQCDGKHF